MLHEGPVYAWVCRIFAFKSCDGAVCLISKIPHISFSIFHLNCSRFSNAQSPGNTIKKYFCIYFNVAYSRIWIMPRIFEAVLNSIERTWTDMCTHFRDAGIWTQTLVRIKMHLGPNSGFVRNEEMEFRLTMPPSIHRAHF